MKDQPIVLLESYSSARDPHSYAFLDGCGELVAHRSDQVLPALEEVDRAVERGLHAAGFLCYEAAAGLDAALETRRAGALPLLWFGLFGRREPVEAGALPVSGECATGAWEASISRSRYEEALAAIAEYILAGHSYQVNFTFRLRADFRGDAAAFYRDLCRAQPASYCAFLDLGEHQILSASPELFFALEGEVLSSRPMKGTQARGRWLEEDEERRRALENSEKERAENTMIVDLLRNDLGRVAQVGSVEVPRLWEVERYPTLWQMTSTVRARRRRGMGLAELMAALFPCGSVTGAPKVRTMQIIAELEQAPRGIYTGCIGFVSPGPQMRFNVAIRTAWIDRGRGRVEFGVGGGITHYSAPRGEYEECRLKSRVLRAPAPEFELLETLLFEGDKGYYLLERHLERLERSADYFGFRCEIYQVAAALEAAAAAWEGGRYRVRMTLGRGGAVAVEGRAWPESRTRSWRFELASEAVDSSDPFLYHKTTNRRIYAERRRAHPHCDEVVLYNERGEITECSTGNLVARIGGEPWTPPRRSGLLAGVFRAELLARGEIRERVLRVEELRAAAGIYLINSVRRWVRLEWFEHSI